MTPYMNFQNLRLDEGCDEQDTFIQTVMFTHVVVKKTLFSCKSLKSISKACFVNFRIFFKQNLFQTDALAVSDYLNLSKVNFR